MKRISLILCVFAVFSSYAQVGIGTIVPNAQLDVVATNRGILIPRVDLTSLTVSAPVINPLGGVLTVSTMVYHNGTNGIVAGYYYWDGSRWQGIGKASEEKGLQYYVFSGTTTAPNTEKSTINSTLVSSGAATGLLDNTMLTTLRGSLNDNFMILLSGTLVVENTGLFQIQSFSDDGSRVVIDNVPVLNRWADQSAVNYSGTAVRLSKGKHKIEFWYYENSGGQDMVFTWLQNANGTTGVINANSFIVE